MSRTKLWIIGITLMAIVVTALGWFAGIEPRIAEARAADKERSTVEATNASHEQVLTVLRALDDRLPELKKELGQLRVALPAETAVSTLLGQLNQLAEVNSVGIESITAGTPLEFAPAPPDQAAPVEPPTGPEGEPAPPSEPADVVAEAPPIVDGLVSVPITVSVTGDAERVEAFIKGVQYGKRLFLVTDLSIDISGSDSKATLDGLVYVLPDVLAADTAPAEPPAE